MTLDFMSYVDEGKVIFATVIESIVQANRGRGVLSGCNVSINTSQLAVDVSDGVVVYDGVHYDVSGSTLVLEVADATKDRLDVIVWDKDNGLTVLTGVDWLYDSSGNYIPKTVRISETQVPLAVVKVPAGSTVVSEVYDVRSSVFEKKTAKSSVYLDSNSVVQVRSDEMLMYHFPRRLEKWSGLLDNSGGGLWYWRISFSLLSSVSEDCNYLIEINGTTVNVYNVMGDLKFSGSISLSFWSNVKGDGSDIRFVNDSGQLYFWIEEWDYANQYAKIWVNLTEGSTKLDLVYGNSSALPSTYNNISKTFLFGDDFSEGLTSNWITYTPNGTSVTVDNGQLVLTRAVGANNGDAVTWPIVYSNITFSNDIVVYAKVNFTTMYDLLTDVQGTTGFYVFRQDGRATASDIIGVYPVGANVTTALASGTVSSPGTYHVSAVVNGSSLQMTVYEKGETITATDSTFTSGAIGIATDGVDGTVYVDWIFVAKLTDPVTITNVSEDVYVSNIVPDYLISGDGSMSGDGLFWGYML